LNPNQLSTLLKMQGRTPHSGQGQADNVDGWGHGNELI
jgi:hypothetical protein